MFVMKVTWEDGEPTIMKCDTLEEAHGWANHYLSKMNDQEVQGMVSVSVERA